MLFISYSKEDRAIATKVYERLVARGYQTPFLDYHPDAGIPGGSPWEKELLWQIKVANGLIVLCSKNWNQSRWCQFELGAATAHGKTIIPLNLDGSTPPNTIAATHQIDFRRPGDKVYKNLWRALEQAQPPLRPGDDFSWPRDKCPYPGFEAFDEEHAGVYFGRSSELDDFFEKQLKPMADNGTKRLIYVFGPSGSGKSSFVRAGIVPRLKFKSRGMWCILTIFRWSELKRDGHTWGERLAADLQRLYREHPNRPNWSANDQIQRYATDGTLKSIEEAAKRFILDVKNLQITLGTKRCTPLLILDQFEELLINESADGDQSRFLKFLQYCLAGENSPCRAVATVRSDFLPVIQQHPDLLKWNEYTQLSRLDLLKRERLFEIVRRPAELVGVSFEPDDLVNRIVDEAKTSDALPLLAFTMRQFYETCGNDKKLTTQEYETQLGGLEKCLQTVAAQVMVGPNGQTLPANSAAVNALRQCFVHHLVRYHEGTDTKANGVFIRRTAKWSDVPKDAYPLLDKMITLRLLKKDVPQGQPDFEATIEVTHEALFRVWDTLKNWLDDSRDELRFRARLADSTSQWYETNRNKRRKRDATILWEGGRLDDVEKLVRGRLWKLTTLELFFVGASIAKRKGEESEKEQRRQRELDQANENVKHQSYLKRWAWVAAGIAAVAFSISMFLKFTADKANDRAQAESDKRLKIADDLATEQTKVADEQKKGAVAAKEFAAQQQTLREKADTRSREVQSLLYDSRISLAYQEWKLSHVELAKEYLRKCPREQRGWEHKYITRLCNSVLMMLPGHGNRVNSVAFDPQGRRLACATSLFSLNELTLNASAGRNTGVVHIWDMTTGHLLRSVQLDAEVAMAVAWSPDGATLAVAGGSDISGNPGTLAVYDTNTWEAVSGHKKHSGRIDHVVFLSDGETIASAGEDKNIILWNVAKDMETRTLQWPRSEGKITGLAIHPRKAQLAIASFRELCVVDLETKEPVFQEVVLNENETDKTTFKTVAFDNTGTVLAAAGSDGDIWLFEPTTMKSKGRIAASESKINALISDSKDHRLLVGAEDATLRIFNLQIGKDERTFRGMSNDVLCIAISSDGQRIAAGTYGSIVVVFDRNRDQEFKTLGSHNSYVRGLMFSPNGTSIATASWDDTVRIWGLSDSDQPLARFAHRRDVNDVVWSPDGLWLATASEKYERDKDYSGEVQLWDARSGVLLKLWEPDVGHKVAVNRVAFSHGVLDGPLLLVSGAKDGTLIVWNPSTREKIRELDREENGIKCLAFSPDDRSLLAVAEAGPVKLWDTTNWTVVRSFGKLDMVSAKKFGHTSSINTVALTKVGKHLATGSDDRTILIWDLSDETAPPIRLEGHTAAVTSLVFNDDATRLFSAANDKTIRVWDVGTAQCMLTLPGAKDTVISLDRDGLRLAWAGADGQVRLYDGSSLDTEPTLRSESQRAFTKVGFSPSSDDLVLVEGSMMQQTQSPFSASIDGSLQSQQSQHVIRWDWKADRIKGLGASDLANLDVAFDSNGDIVTLGIPASEFTPNMGFPGFNNKELCVWDVSKNVIETLKIPSTSWQWPRLSPAGKYIAVPGNAGTLTIWNRQTLDAEPRSVTIPGGVAQASFSTDEQRLLVSVSRHFSFPRAQSVKLCNDFKIVDVLSASEVNTIPFGSMAIGNLSPDGSELAVVYGGFTEPTNLVFVDSSTGEPRSRFDLAALSGEFPSILSYSPDGKRIAVALSTGKTLLIDKQLSYVVHSFHPTGSAVLDLQFSREGKLLAICTSDGTARVYDLEKVLNNSISPSLNASKSTVTTYDNSPERLREWYLYHAERCESAEHWSGALWHLQRLEKLTVELNLSMLARLAHAKLMVGDFDAAIENLIRAIDGGLKNAAVHRDFGDALLNKQQHEAALKQFDLSLGFDPGAWRSHNGKGVAMFWLNANEDAEEAFSKALQIDNSDPNVFENRGTARKNQGKLRPAIDDFTEALRLSQSASMTSYRERARCYLRLGLWEKCLSDCNNADAFPEAVSDAELLDLRGLALMGLSRWKDAEQAYDRYIQHFPLAFDGYLMRSFTRFEQAKVIEARADIEKALDLGHDQFSAWQWAALAYLAIDDRANYSRCCKELVARFSDTGDADLNSKIIFTCVVGPQAVDDYSDLFRLAKLARTSGHLTDKVYAGILLRAGKVEDAIELLTPIMSAEVGEVIARIYLAIALRTKQTTLSKGRDLLDEGIRNLELASSASGEDQESEVLEWSDRLRLRLLRREVEVLYNESR